MNVHDIFPAEKLRLAFNDALPGQTNENQPPIHITGDDEWEIKEVITCRLRRNFLKYRVTWLNRDEDLDWIPASDLKYAPHKFKEFHLNNPHQQGPPAQLFQWIKKWERGVDNYDELNNNKAMNKRSRTGFFLKGG